MDLATLQGAVRNSAAICYRFQYQPTAGPGAKVYPAIYSEDGEGQMYAKETRYINGERVPCVLVDSVPSQANRLEETLSAARDHSAISFPVIGVDLTAHGHGVVTSLDLPHRAADAYLTFAYLDGQPWTKHDKYKAIANCGPQHATALYLADPITLLFGAWFSHDKNAAGRFGRLLVSEMVAIDAEQGVKSASRLDSLSVDTATTIGNKLLEKYEIGIKVKKQEKSKKEQTTPVGKLGFGNVLPTVKNMGGITCDHVLQTSTISLSGLRRLSFPAEDGTSNERDEAARTVLAALGLFALESMAASGVWLRSGCDLVAETFERTIVPPNNGSFELSVSAASELFAEAVKAAESAGLSWDGDLILDGDTEVLTTRFANLTGGAK